MKRKDNENRNETKTKIFFAENVKTSDMVPEPQGSKGGADLRFLSTQPDTSLHCETIEQTSK